MFSTYLIYFLVLSLSTTSLYFADRANSRLKKAIFVTLSFMIVFVIASIRYNVGSDYPNYAEIFYSIQGGGSKDIEVGFRYLNLFFSSLGFGFQGFVVFVSFITYLIFYSSYPKEKSYIYHFVFLCTLYLYTLSNLRSSIIYGLSFIAILKYIDDKKMLNFCLLIFFSMLFHKSSVVYLIIPIIFSKPIKEFVNSKYIPEVVLFFLIAIMFNSSWLRDVIFYNPISEILGFSSYANHEKWGGASNVGSGLRVFLEVLCPSIFIIFRRYLISRDERMVYIVILCFLYVLLVDLALSVKIATRLKYLFISTNMLIIYYLVLYLSSLRKVFLVYPIMLALALTYFKTIQESDVVKFGDKEAGIKVSPYVTIFEKHKSPRTEVFIN